MFQLYFKQMKSYLSLTFVVLVLVASLLLIEAQVNFSPSWGKRAKTNPLINGIQGAEPGDFTISTLSGPDNCKTPIESILRIQRLIQVAIEFKISIPVGVDTHINNTRYNL